MGFGILNGIQLIRITHIAIIGLSTNNPVPAIQRHVDGTNSDCTLHFIVGLSIALQVVGVGIVG